MNIAKHDARWNIGVEYCSSEYCSSEKVEYCSSENLWIYGSHQCVSMLTKHHHINHIHIHPTFIELPIQL